MGAHWKTDYEHEHIQLEAAKTELRHMEEKYERLHREYNEYKDRCHSWEEKFAHLFKEASELHGTVKLLKKERGFLLLKLHGKKRTIKDLEHQVSEWKAKYYYIDEECDKLKIRIEKLKVENHHLQDNDQSDAAAIAMWRAKYLKQKQKKHALIEINVTLKKEYTAVH